MPPHRSDQALFVQLLLTVCSRIGCLRLSQTLKAFSKVVAVLGLHFLSLLPGSSNTQKNKLHKDGPNLDVT